MLVEGWSDQAAIETLTQRVGLNLGTCPNNGTFCARSTVEQVIAAEGETSAFQRFQVQPHNTVALWGRRRFAPLVEAPASH